MSTLHEQVLAMIEEELRANPSLDNKTLRIKAEEIDPGIAELDARKFNGRYSLQVKRKLAPPKPRKPRKKKAPPVEATPAPVASPAFAAAASTDDDLRAEVRDTLLDLARDIATVDRVGLINVIGGIDDYVQRIMEAVEAN